MQMRISLFLDHWNEGRRCMLLGGPKSDQLYLPSWLQDYVNFRSASLLSKESFPHVRKTPLERDITADENEEFGFNYFNHNRSEEAEQQFADMMRRAGMDDVPYVREQDAFDSVDPQYCHLPVGQPNHSQSLDEDDEEAPADAPDGRRPFRKVSNTSRNPVYRPGHAPDTATALELARCVFISVRTGKDTRLFNKERALREMVARFNDVYITNFTSQEEKLDIKGVTTETQFAAEFLKRSKEVPEWKELPAHFIDPTSTRIMHKHLWNMYGFQAPSYRPGSEQDIEVQASDEGG
eukprot:3933462-Rhodomonas_salina.1